MFTRLTALCLGLFFQSSQPVADNLSGIPVITCLGMVEASGFHKRVIFSQVPLQTDRQLGYKCLQVMFRSNARRPDPFCTPRPAYLGQHSPQSQLG